MQRGGVPPGMHSRHGAFAGIFSFYFNCALLAKLFSAAMRRAALALF
jgi:hypothetical protein